MIALFTKVSGEPGPADRQREQLLEERRRLTAQLTHERQLHDVRELRAFLDGGVEHISRCTQNLALTNGGLDQLEAEGPSRELREDIAATWERYTDGVGDLPPFYHKIALRVEGYTDVPRTWKDLWEEMSEAVTRRSADGTGLDRRDREAEQDKIMDAFAEFTNAARGAVGSDVAGAM